MTDKDTETQDDLMMNASIRPAVVLALVVLFGLPIGVVAGTLNGECLLDWAETEYPELLAAAGAETIETPPYHYRAYADTNALLGISDADHRLYYQGPDQVLVDLGPLSTWLETADCLPPPTACLFDWVEQTYPDAFAPAGAVVLGVLSSKIRDVSRLLIGNDQAAP